ncbi:hypothetical protein F4808DRAFT_125370 [Astrocystis sublimbata]|nr:hypothetical protein F4808DRAFT_125370 [Astrocystis sublimbata]
MAATQVINSNHFRQVLGHFDEAGALIDQNTRITIECAICRIKNLALTNKKFDVLKQESHETFMVLPACGHAFGTECLQAWLDDDEGRYRICPICREKTTCPKGHPCAEQKFGTNDPQQQASEIRTIRAMLENKHCQQCYAKVEFEQRQILESQIHGERMREYMDRYQTARGPERAFLNARITAEKERYAQVLEADGPDTPQLRQFTRRAQKQQEEIKTLVSQGTSLHARNEKAWDSVQSRLRQIQDRLQHKADMESTNGHYWALHHASHNTQTKITMEHNSNGRRGRFDQDTWQQIDTELDNSHDHAQGWIAHETTRLEKLSAFKTHLDALEALLKDNQF